MVADQKVFYVKVVLRTSNHPKQFLKGNQIHPFDHGKNGEQLLGDSSQRSSRRFSKIERVA